MIKWNNSQDPISYKLPHYFCPLCHPWSSSDIRFLDSSGCKGGHDALDVRWSSWWRPLVLLKSIQISRLNPDPCHRASGALNNSEIVHLAPADCQGWSPILLGSGHRQCMLHCSRISWQTLQSSGVATKTHNYVRHDKPRSTRMVLDFCNGCHQQHP